MKFVYVDESGATGEPYVVFFGLEIDAYKLKKATREAQPLFEKIRDACPSELKELKSSRLVGGKGSWKGVDPQVRKSLFLDLCGYPDGVQASAYCFLVDRERFQGSGARPSWATSMWLAGAIGLSLTVQRQNQVKTNNKGLSVLIFDDNKIELPKLSEFLSHSASDADDFYDRDPKGEPFDHIVDTAFAIKSEHSHLVQVSDACAYALRRLAELELGQDPDAWAGEKAFFKQAVGRFSSRIRFPAKVWTAHPASSVATWLRDISHPHFNKWVKP